MSIQTISTDLAPRPAGPYSQAIAVNGFVYTAGQTPHHPVTGEAIGTTIEEQTRQTIENLKAVLAAGGLALTDVVKATVHLHEPERDRSGFNAVYGEYFSSPYPVRTTVGSFLGNFLVEIDVVAAIPAT
ncbi:Rid family detoxifying hydrolase [Nonomuraea sp. NPDC026600]|uniref:RidA family protein n=1 Tax=Nonomuraea sp. NPDC026600 TaxID=3155363 RepID=UPI0033FCC556